MDRVIKSSDSGHGEEGIPGDEILKNNVINKFSSDSGHFTESEKVIRYIGASIIKEMVKKQQYAEAFTHTQIGVEKILWDRIVNSLTVEKQHNFRQAVEYYIRGQKNNLLKQPS